MNEIIPFDLLDPSVQKAITKAEKSDRFGYGAFIENGEQVFVTVTFYPKRKWWIIDQQGRSELTTQRYANLTRLKLV